MHKVHEAADRIGFRAVIGNAGRVENVGSRIAASDPDREYWFGSDHSSAVFLCHLGYRSRGSF